MAKKIVKRTAIGLACAIGAVILAVVVYIIYVAAQYYRIPDNAEIVCDNPVDGKLPAEGTHTLVTYNVGFGAYSPDFSFFMDSGRMKSGEKVSGKGSKAKDRQRVLDNTQGALDAVVPLAADFYFFQEVDTDATRSRHVNQLELLKAGLGSGYSASFAENFHSAFLFYPIFDPHGSVNAGLATFSKHEVTGSVRRSFPIDESFPQKYLDLDRCFLVTRVKVDNGRELVLVHQHMSAYDEGGKIRAKQLETINAVLAEERAKGNYVIAGGDFNHVLTERVDLFPCEQEIPEWVARLEASDLAEGYSIAAAENAATCRSSDMPYTPGVNYTAVLDGFLVSDNISYTVETVDTGFAYSDHNPVRLDFRLN